jgi:putative exosortase-associated protein (TIGR04073 family)
MRKTLPLLAVLVIAGTMATGCANTERKLGRGIANMFEIVRWGEFQRSCEQAALWEGGDTAYTYGAIHGIDRTLARTGIGLYEVVTFPIPPYGPVFTDTFSPNPVYPENFTPGVKADRMYATDADLGFSGGDVAPWWPGSRFRIFEGH